jgi:hypothetical protein
MDSLMYSRALTQYSNLDIVDRREIKHLDPENFWRYIGKSEVLLEQPGHLSAVTVAKGVEYGVNLLAPLSKDT